jgi:FkbM family methyltransferase
MSALSRVRQFVRALGLDVSRFPGEHPTYQLVKQLASQDVTCVLDVGANDGGYARDLRRFGYSGRIVSFEPVGAAFRQAVVSAADDGAWELRHCALGPEQATVTINIAGNAGASSSILPMLPLHEEAAPTSAFVNSEQVEQRRLDDVWQDVVRAGERVFLKLDVQGYEKHVLEGAKRVLEDGLVLGLQLELSLQPLYLGGWSYLEALQWASGRGYELCQLIPGFADSKTGHMLQVDAVFFRGSESWN